MQDFIKFLEYHGELKIIDTPLDIELEIPHLAYLEVKKEDSKALLFTHPIYKKQSFHTLSQYDTNQQIIQKNHIQAHTTTHTHNKQNSMRNAFLHCHNDEKYNEITENFTIPVLMNVFGSHRRLTLIATVS